MNMMLILNIVAFVAWLIAGPLVLSLRNIPKFLYAICWFTLMVNLLAKF